MLRDLPDIIKGPDTEHRKVFSSHKVLCHETNVSHKTVILFPCLLLPQEPTWHLWQNYILPSSSRSEVSFLLSPKLSSTPHPSLQERLVKLISAKKSSIFFLLKIRKQELYTNGDQEYPPLPENQTDSSQVQGSFFSSLKSIKSKATKTHSKAQWSVCRSPLTFGISVTLPVWNLPAQ